MDIVQIMIMIMGGAAIWMISRAEPWGRWGYVVGLCSEPFWLYETYTSQQWGMFVLTLWYAYAFSQGIYNFIIKPWRQFKKQWYGG